MFRNCMKAAQTMVLLLIPVIARCSQKRKTNDSETNDRNGENNESSFDASSLFSFEEEQSSITKVRADRNVEDTEQSISSEQPSSSNPSPSQPARTLKERFYRNPWLNFLRDFRKDTSYGTIESTKEGSKRWRTMSEAEKLKYYRQAFKARPRPKLCICPLPTNENLKLKRRRRIYH